MKQTIVATKNSKETLKQKVKRWLITALIIIILVVAFATIKAFIIYR